MIILEWATRARSTLYTWQEVLSLPWERLVNPTRMGRLRGLLGISSQLGKAPEKKMEDYAGSEITS